MELGSPERLVTLATLGVRCLEYYGHDSSDALRTLNRPIDGLLVRVRTSPEQPTFHPHSSVYGFRRQRPGGVLIEVRDPRGRFLPSAISFDVDSRLDDFQSAFAQGGVPDTTGWQPIVTAPLLPAIRSALPSGSSGITGSVLDASGDPAPYARIDVTTVGGGHYRTMADKHGDYFIRLHDARSGIDSGTGHRNPSITRDVVVHRFLGDADADDILRELPVNFHELRSSDPTFGDWYAPIASDPTQSVSLEVGILNRVDLDFS